MVEGEIRGDKISIKTLPLPLPDPLERIILRWRKGTADAESWFRNARTRKPATDFGHSSVWLSLKYGSLCLAVYDAVSVLHVVKVIVSGCECDLPAHSFDTRQQGPLIT